MQGAVAPSTGGEGAAASSPSAGALQASSNGSSTTAATNSSHVAVSGAWSWETILSRALFGTSYTTTKVVELHDPYLRLLFWSLRVAAITYIVLVQMLLNHGYASFQSVSGYGNVWQGRTSKASTSLSHCNNPALDWGADHPVWVRAITSTTRSVNASCVPFLDMLHGIAGPDSYKALTWEGDMQLVESRPQGESTGDTENLPGPRLELPVLPEQDYSAPPLPPLGTPQAKRARQALAQAAEQAASEAAQQGMDERNASIHVQTAIMRAAREQGAQGPRGYLASGPAAPTRIQLDGHQSSYRFYDKPEQAAFNMIYSVTAPNIDGSITSPHTRLLDGDGNAVREWAPGNPAVGITVGELLRMAGIDSLDDEHTQGFIPGGLSQPTYRSTGVVLVATVRFSNRRRWEWPVHDPRVDISVRVLQGAWGFLGTQRRYVPVDPESGLALPPQPVLAGPRGAATADPRLDPGAQGGIRVTSAVNTTLPDSSVLRAPSVPVDVLRTGVVVRFVSEGTMGVFDAGQVLLRLVEAIVLFNLAQTLCDLVASHVSPYAAVYRARMVETHELHAVRQARIEHAEMVRKGSMGSMKGGSKGKGRKRKREDDEEGMGSLDYGIAVQEESTCASSSSNRAEMEEGGTAASGEVEHGKGGGALTVGGASAI